MTCGVLARKATTGGPQVEVELPRVFRTREFAVLLRGCLHFPALVHGLLRGPVFEGGVETLPIAAEVDVTRDVFGYLHPCRIDNSMDALHFQRPVKRLCQ